MSDSEQGSGSEEDASGVVAVLERLWWEHALSSKGSEDTAQQPPADPDGAQVGSVAGQTGQERQDNHRYWWLTRTNRASTCHGSGKQIAKAEFKALFHRHPDSVVDKRQWGKLWLKYQHLSASCLLGSVVPLDRDTLVIDVAPLPKVAKETAEIRDAAIEGAVCAFLREFGEARLRQHPEVKIAT